MPPILNKAAYYKFLLDECNKERKKAITNRNEIRKLLPTEGTTGRPIWMGTRSAAKKKLETKVEYLKNLTRNTLALTTQVEKMSHDKSILKQEIKRLNSALIIKSMNLKQLIQREGDLMMQCETQKGEMKQILSENKQIKTDIQTTLERYKKIEHKYHEQKRLNRKILEKSDEWKRKYIDNNEALIMYEDDRRKRIEEQMVQNAMAAAQEGMLVLICQ